MKTKSPTRRWPTPLTLALLATSGLAPVFGALYAGRTGAVIAFLAWSGLVTGPRLLKSPSRPAVRSRPRSAPVATAAYTPGASVAGEAVALLLRVVIGILGLVVAFSRLVSALTQPEELPWTMVNLTLAIILASCLFGIDAAFYAALVGVPIVILTLIVVAFEPSAEPQLVLPTAIPDAPRGDIEAAT